MTEIIIQDKDGNRVFPLPDGIPVFVGRATECDICLQAPGVSRKHAVILERNGVCGVKDLDSSNGTFVNGRRLNRSIRLKNGDTLRIAGFTLAIRTTRAAINEETKKSQRAVSNTLRHIADTEFEKSERSDFHSTPSETALATVAENYRQTLPVPDPVRAAPEEEPVPAAESATEAIPAEDKAPAPPPTSDSASPKTAHTPVLPPREVISDDEVGDGESDHAFLIEEESEEDGDSGAAALAKAAAEAGIVGEFNPDTEEEGSAPQSEDDPQAVAQSGPLAFSQSLTQAIDPAKNPHALPLNLDLRQAIEARLCFYSFLNDLKQERDDFIARRPKMADAVKSELARQDREMDKIPNAQQAESMIEKRRAKTAALKEKIREAKQNGTPPPPKPSRDMREAEEIAIAQWTIIAQSYNEALPAAYAEAFRLAEREPLTQYLRKAGISPITLMGGGVYYIALEQLQEEAKIARQELRDQMAALSSVGDRKASGGGRMLAMFGRQKEEEEREEEGEEADPEELAANEKHLADRMASIKKELEFQEKALIQEFWKVYGEVALHFLPDHENMPMAVRAFLRHGVIGFEKWWMKDEVRDHIIEDCRDDVIHHMEVGKNNTNVVYADEYLAAVMNLECTPALDENLEINERNSPNWKADKALRKLINSRSQATLLEELLETLATRIEGLESEAAAVDQQIDKLLPGSKNVKAIKSELSQKRQSYRVEISKISKLMAKIKGETLAALRETIQETEERFDSGELPKPSGEFLIKRECEALHKIGRLLANLKERFMPLVVRDSFQIGTDAVNDRPSIRGEILEMERRDPAIFLENLVPSKKKAARVDLRISPVIVLIPSAGILAYSWNPRGKPEDGRLAIPTCFIRRRIRERQITYLLADFRWDTSKAAAGMDVMTSDTIVAAFMTVRWDWRKRSKEGREKGLIFTEQNDRTNWRRVYEAYSQTAYDAGKKLYNRNYDFYERIIGKYFDMPENVTLLRK